MYINIYVIINIKLYDSVKMDWKDKILMHITAIEFKYGDNKILLYYSIGELYMIFLLSGFIVINLNNTNLK